MGRDFLGTYDLFADALLLFERGVHDRVTEPVRCNGLDDGNCRGCCRKKSSPKLRDDIPPLLRIKTASDHSAERSRAGKYGKKKSRWIHLPSRPRRPF